MPQGPCPPGALSPARVHRGRGWPLLCVPWSVHRARTAPQHGLHACCPWGKKGFQQLGWWEHGCAGQGRALSRARSLGARGRRPTPGCQPVCRRQGGCSPRAPGRGDLLWGGSSWAGPRLLGTCLVGWGIASRKGVPQNSHGEGLPVQDLWCREAAGRGGARPGALALEGSAWPRAEPPGMARPWGDRLADAALKAKLGPGGPEGVGTGLTEPGEVQGPLLTRTPSYMAHRLVLAPLAPAVPVRSRTCRWLRPGACGPCGGVARGLGTRSCRLGRLQAGGGTVPAPGRGLGVGASGLGEPHSPPCPGGQRADTDRSRTAAPGQEALWGERSSRASLRRASALGLPGSSDGRRRHLEWRPWGASDCSLSRLPVSGRGSCRPSVQTGQKRERCSQHSGQTPRSHGGGQAEPLQVTQRGADPQVTQRGADPQVTWRGADLPGYTAGGRPLQVTQVTDQAVDSLSGVVIRWLSPVQRQLGW